MSKHDLKAKTLLVEQIQAFINENPVLVASLLRYTSPITFTNPLDIVDKQYVDGLFNSFTIDGFLSGSILVSDPYDGSIETVNMNWRINNVNYSDASEDFTAIPLSSSGNQRYIAFYGDATNAVTKVEGVESALAVFPETPAGKVLLGFVLVKDTEVEPPEYIPVGFAQLGTVNHFSQRNYFDNSIEVIGQILLNGVPIGDGAGGLLQFDTVDDFPLTGSANFVYLDKSETKIYYWDADSSEYFVIGGGSSDPVLQEFKYLNREANISGVVSLTGETFVPLKPSSYVAYVSEDHEGSNPSAGDSVTITYNHLDKIVSGLFPGVEHDIILTGLAGTVIAPNPPTDPITDNENDLFKATLPDL